jgi:hypothetical protein
MQGLSHPQGDTNGAGEEARKRLVLDTNILLCGVFRIRVRSLLEAPESSVSSYAPDT